MERGFACPRTPAAKLVPLGFALRVRRVRRHADGLNEEGLLALAGFHLMAGRHLGGVARIPFDSGGAR